MSVVRFQPVPVDSLQAMAEPLSQNGGTSGEVCLRKAESTTERGGGKKKPEKKQREDQSWRRRRRQCCRCWNRDSPADSAENRGAGISLLPMQRPYQSRHPRCSQWMILHWSRWIFPEGTTAYGEPVLEQIDPEGPQHVERTHIGAGKRCEEEGAAEMF